MKRIILTAAIILMMAGTVFAHEPNSLPDNRSWQMDVNDKGIATLVFRLSDEQFYVYRQGGIRPTVIISRIQASVISQVKRFWGLWLESRDWKERKQQQE